MIDIFNNQGNISKDFNIIYSMRRVIITAIIVNLLISSSYSQNKRDYIWLSGYSFYTDNTKILGNKIDFNNGGKIDSLIVGGVLFGNNAIICDKAGKLLFYFGGCKVIDNTYHLMENGDSINYGEAWEEECPGFGIYTGTQNSIILPDPGNEDAGRNGYYLIHKRYELIYEPIIQAYSPELYYTYIDMNENNGKGRVIKKNHAIFTTTNMPISYLTACKHANGKDWWIISQKKDTNLYYIVLLNTDTILLKDSISIGNKIDIFSGHGQAKFSPDGSKYLIFNEVGVLIHDFNRETGELSNFRQVITQDSSGFEGLAISPNSRFAYLSATSDLYQIDLWADDIQSSLVHLDHWDGFNDYGFPVTFSNAQLAPDCKIYISSPNTVLHMSVINKPNEKGKACDFRQHALEFPNLIGASSIPNFPNFRIDGDQVCDSTITWIPDEYIVAEPNVLSVYPNPAYGKATISVYSDGFEHGIIRIFNITGQLVRSMYIDSEATRQLDVSNMVPGVYAVEYVSYVSGGRDVRKLVVE